MALLIGPLPLGLLFGVCPQGLHLQWWLIFFSPLLLFVSYRFDFYFSVFVLVGLWGTGLPLWSTFNGSGHPLFVFDWINLPFLLLVAVFFPYVFACSSESIRGDKRVFACLLLLIEVFLLVLFSTQDFLVFYVFFEMIAFPMFLLIGTYGSQPARIPAAYKFFVYTFGGSVLMLAGLLGLYYFYGSCRSDLEVDSLSQVYFFFLVFFALAVKVPMVPFHLWLPEAHVEAPTGVSVLLAALLLKTGGYGFVRFVLPMFPSGVHFWGSAVMALALSSVLYASWSATAQTDIKKMIAYSSVAHMNVSVLGLFSGSVLAVQFSTYMMLAHAFVSAGLFTGVGVIYDRFHTRSVRGVSGLVNHMPNFYFWYFLLVLCNFSFPFSGSFCSELVVFQEVVRKNPMAALLGGLTIFFSAIYSVWFVTRVFNGPQSRVVRHQDLTPREWGLLVFCVLSSLVLGFYSWEFSSSSFEDYCRCLGYRGAP